MMPDIDMTQPAKLVCWPVPYVSIPGDGKCFNSLERAVRFAVEELPAALGELPANVAVSVDILTDRDGVLDFGTVKSMYAELSGDARGR